MWLWGLATETHARDLSGHAAQTLFLAFSPNGGYLLAGLGACMAGLRGTATGVLLENSKDMPLVFGVSHTYLIDVMWPPLPGFYQTVVAASRRDGTIQFWDVTTGQTWALDLRSHLYHIFT